MIWLKMRNVRGITWKSLKKWWFYSKCVPAQSTSPARQPSPSDPSLPTSPLCFEGIRYKQPMEMAKKKPTNKKALGMRQNTLGMRPNPSRIQQKMQNVLRMRQKKCSKEILIKLKFNFFNIFIYYFRFLEEFPLRGSENGKKKNSKKWAQKRQLLRGFYSKHTSNPAFFFFFAGSFPLRFFFWFDLSGLNK